MCHQWRQIWHHDNSGCWLHVFDAELECVLQSIFNLPHWQLVIGFNDAMVYAFHYNSCMYCDHCNRDKLTHDHRSKIITGDRHDEKWVLSQTLINVKCNIQTGECMAYMYIDHSLCKVNYIEFTSLCVTYSAINNQWNQLRQTYYQCLCAVWPNQER